MPLHKNGKRTEKKEKGKEERKRKRRHKTLQNDGTIKSNLSVPYRNLFMLGGKKLVQTEAVRTFGLYLPLQPYLTTTTTAIVS